MFSKEKYDWPGHGMYFWENNYERALQTEGGPVFTGAGILEKSHIQICIRNPNCIKGFFLPRKEVVFPKLAEAS